VKDRQHDLDGGTPPFSITATGIPAAVVCDGHRVVGVDDDRNLAAEARERLVDGVVDDLVDEVVKAHHARRADVHAGTLADRLEALEDRDVLCVVAGGPTRHGRVVDAALAGVSFRAAACCGQMTLR